MKARTETRNCYDWGGIVSEVAWTAPLPSAPSRLRLDSTDVKLRLDSTFVSPVGLQQCTHDTYFLSVLRYLVHCEARLIRYRFYSTSKSEVTVRSHAANQRNPVSQLGPSLIDKLRYVISFSSGAASRERPALAGPPRRAARPTFAAASAVRPSAGRRKTRAEKWRKCSTLTTEPGSSASLASSARVAAALRL